MAEAARAVSGTAGGTGDVSFAYRLVSPLFDDQGLVVSATADANAVRVRARDSAGRTTATGVIQPASAHSRT